jgi:hypothetical protein
MKVAQLVKITKFTETHHAIMLSFYVSLRSNKEARGSVVGLGTMLQAGRWPVRVPDEVDFFQLT